MMQTEEFTISDMLAIQGLIYSYSKRLDSGDLESLGKLFDRAVVHFEGRDSPIDSDPAAIAGMFSDFVRLYGGIPRTRHLICNLTIEPDGPNQARATSAVLVVQQTPDLPLQPIITGDYRDRFVKADGQWHFAERYITNDLFGDLSAHGKYSIGTR